MRIRSALLPTAALLGAIAMNLSCDASGVEEPAPDDAWGTQLVTEGNNALAIRLYRELVAGGGEADNVFFSPMSIAAALSLTYEGARGETRMEFEHMLGVSSDIGDWGRPQYHRAMGGLLASFNGDDEPYELAVANALWGEQSMPFAPAFTQTLDAHYDAGLELVDFKADAEAQRTRINDWVADRTHDRIQGLMPEGSVDALTRLVLVNAIYFKAQWANTFAERATQDGTFYLAGDAEGDSVDVPLMRHREERFRVGTFDGYDALQLNYQGGDLSMVVLLPDTVDGIGELEARLTPELIAQTIDALAYQTTNVWLPKWEMTLDYDLIPALKAMGMERAFDPGRADFTGISDSADGESIYITGAFHKAFIAVDENGTEAAAATGFAAGVASAPPPQAVFDFRADHPFVYLIRDNRSGAILFMGRVTDPS
ncbi:MAG: serpin family protein [Phycisphaerales bacterium JB063]